MATSRLLEVKARFGPEAVVFSRATPAGSASGDFAAWLERVLTFHRLVQYCDEQQRHVPRLRRQAPKPVVEIHPRAAEAAAIDPISASVPPRTRMCRVRKDVVSS